MATEIADLYVLLQGRFGQFVSEANKAKIEGETFAARAQSGIAAFGKVGMVAAGAFAAAGALVTHMAGNYQAALTMIQTHADASAKEVRNVNKAIMAMAPQVGYGPQTLAEAFYHVESAGYRGAKAITAVRDAAKLAQVGGANLEDTVNAVVGLLQTGVVKSSGDAVASINAIIGAGNMRMQDFVNSLSSGVMASAASFGISLNTVGAAMALMTDQGIPAELAATRLRMSMSLMAAPSKKATKLLEDAGLSAKDAADATSKMQQAFVKAGVSQTTLAADLRQPDGFMVALKDLKDHMDAAGVSAGEQAAVISQAFGGGKSGSAIEGMITKLGLLQQKYSTITDTAGRFGSAWHKTQQNFNVQWDRTKALLEEVAVKIGTRLLPVADRLLSWIRDATTWLEHHKKVAETVAIVVGITLVAAMGAFAESLTSVAVAWAMTPFGAIFIAVEVLIVAVVLLWTHWNQVWGWIMHHKAYAAIIAAMFPITAVIVGLVAVARYLYTHWSTIWPAIQRVVGSVTSAILTDTRHIADYFLDMAGTIIHVVAAIADHLPFFPKSWKKALDQARTDIDTFHSTLDSKFTLMAAQAAGWGNAVGAAIATGMANGIDQHLATAVVHATQLGHVTVAALRGAVQAQSPSKATMQIGQWFAQGFAAGIDNRRRDGTTAATALASASLGALAVRPTAATALAGGTGSPLNQGMTVEIYVDNGDGYKRVQRQAIRTQTRNGTNRLQVQTR